MAHLEQRLRKVAAAIMVLAFLGLADAGYLTAHKLFGTPLQCGVSSGCETVANSAYSNIFGIPLSLIGMIFYITMFFGALIYREFGLQKVLKAISFLSIISALTAAWLVAVQLLIIHAVCKYCMASAVISLFLVSLGIYTLVSLKKPTPETSVPSRSPNEGGLE